MPKSSYDEAPEAWEHFISYYDNLWRTLPTRSFTPLQRHVEFVKNRAKLQLKNLLDAREMMKPSGYDAALKLLAEPEALVLEAQTDRTAFDELRAAIAWLVDREKLPPRSARDWLVLYLRGKVEEPAPHDGRTLPQIGKVIFVCDTIQMLCNETGMKPTQNQEPSKGESQSLGTCACEVVAEAFAQMNLTPMTYRGIKDLWGQRPEAWRGK